MFMLTGGWAEITGLAAAPVPGVGAGVALAFSASTQRVFGYRVEALDAQTGAVAARDTIPAVWASDTPTATSATVFADALPSGSYRLRVTPLGRCSYEDRCAIEADAVESGVVVAGEAGAPAAAPAVRLALRGAARTRSAEPPRSRCRS